MQNYIFLLSNNFFFGIGLYNLIPTDCQLQIISSQDISSQDSEISNIPEKLIQAKLILITKEFASSQATISLVQSLLNKNIKIIYLAEPQDKLICELFSLGCQGIIRTNLVQDQLQTAINAVLTGGTYYSQGLLDSNYKALLAPLVNLLDEFYATIETLTPREKDIFKLYTSGFSLTQIMDQLKISKSTINTHMESIRSKSGVDSNREITVKYQVTQLESNL